MVPVLRVQDRESTGELGKGCAGTLYCITTFSAISDFSVCFHVCCLSDSFTEVLYLTSDLSELVCVCLPLNC